jgi:hypothetical protein
MTGEYVPGLRIRLGDRPGDDYRGLSQRGRRTRAASPHRKQGQVEQPGRDAQRQVTGDDRAARRRSPACRSAASSRTCCGQGQHDQASQAASELPDKADTGSAQHAGMLSKYGIDPASITDKLGSIGKTL